MYAKYTPDITSFLFKEPVRPPSPSYSTNIEDNYRVSAVSVATMGKVALIQHNALFTGSGDCMGTNMALNSL